MKGGKVMKKKRYYILLTVILVIFASIFTMQTVFAKENTSYKGLWDEDAGAYLITDTNDLKIFRNSLSEYDYAGKKVLLTQNIDIKKDDDIGTVVEHNLKRELTMSNKDPLSAKYTITQKMKNGRDGWLTDCDIVVTQTADKDNFYITGHMDASINDEHVFHRDYDYKVKRNGI